MTTSGPNTRLEDVVVSTSEICFIDGHRGRLLYRGYDIHDLVAQSSFEETVSLLWHGRLPERNELERLRKALATQRRLPPKVMALLKGFPRKADAMDVLRTAVSALGLLRPRHRGQLAGGHPAEGRPHPGAGADPRRRLERIRKGKPLVAPNPRLGLAANFLYMLTGKKPTDLAARRWTPRSSCTPTTS